MKRFCAALLAVFLLLSAVPAFAAEGTAYNDLLRAGFPDEFLDTIDEDFLNKIAEDCAAAESIDVDATAAELTGSNDETQLTFWLVTAKISDGDIVQSLNLYTYYRWANDAPAVRKTDHVAVSWDPAMWGCSSSTFSATLSNDQGVVYTDKAIYSLGSDQISWDFDLPEADGGSPYGGAWFQLLPLSTSLSCDEAAETVISGAYTHVTEQGDELQLVESSEQSLQCSIEIFAESSTNSAALSQNRLLPIVLSLLALLVVVFLGSAAYTKCRKQAHTKQ
jgi:hypothetical protein